MPVIPVVQVGNSHRLRIPKKLWDAIGPPTQVQLNVQDGILFIRPLSTPRPDWDSPSKWPGAALTDEDETWLNAPLSGKA